MNTFKFPPEKKTDITPAKRCTHKFNDDTYCKREREDSGYCQFHTPTASLLRINSETYLEELCKLIKSGDGDWRGFIFPESLHLERGVPPVSIPINAQGAILNRITLENITFQESVDFSNAKANHDISLTSCTFEKDLIYKEISFSGDCNIRNITVDGDFSASSCHYYKDFSMSGTVRGKASFDGSIFDNKVKFFSSTNIVINVNSFQSAQTSTATATSKSPTQTSKLYIQVEKLLTQLKNIPLKHCKSVTSNIRSRVYDLKKVLTDQIYSLKRKLPHEEEGVTVTTLFHNETRMNGLVFESPQKVLFIGVDLSMVIFGETDLRAVTLVNNIWFQKDLKRNGLYEDSNLKNKDYNTKKKQQPLIENSYRNIRYLLESNKDYAKANDFFIGEMDAQRKQFPFLKRHIFSVLAWYNYISKYGTRPLRVLGWFIFSAAIHSTLLFAVNEREISESYPISDSFVEENALPSSGFDRYLRVSCFELKKAAAHYAYSLQTMTLQKKRIPLTDKNKGNLSEYINLLFSIIGPVLAGLFALSIRTRIKRH